MAQIEHTKKKVLKSFLTLHRARRDNDFRDVCKSVVTGSIPLQISASLIYQIHTEIKTTEYDSTAARTNSVIPQIHTSFRQRIKKEP